MSRYNLAGLIVGLSLCVVVFVGTFTNNQISEQAFFSTNQLSEPQAEQSLEVSSFIYESQQLHILENPLIQSTSGSVQTQNCEIPEAWQSYTIQFGDTLSSISRKFRVSIEEIIQANCLQNVNIIYQGEILYVPNNFGNNSNILLNCYYDPPNNWRRYVVDNNDTLFSLANEFNVSLNDIIKYNCVVDPNLIFSGQSLFLPIPPTPTSTPIPPTPTSTPIPPTPTSTPIPPAPTSTPIPPKEVVLCLEETPVLLKDIKYLNNEPSLSMMSYRNYSYFYIKNCGEANLTVSNIELRGGDKHNFSLSFSSQFTLNSEQTCRIQVDYHPRYVSSLSVGNSIADWTSIFVWSNETRRKVEDVPSSIVPQVIGSVTAQRGKRPPPPPPPYPRVHLLITLPPPCSDFID